MPVPMDETPEADATGTPTPQAMNALMALALRQQQERQKRQAEANAALEEQASGQRGQAQALRNLALLSSFGSNPLLQGLQREAGQQGAQLEGMAARTEGRAHPAGRTGELSPGEILRAAMRPMPKPGKRELSTDPDSRESQIAQATLRNLFPDEDGGRFDTVSEAQFEAVRKSLEEEAKIAAAKEAARLRAAHRGTRAGGGKPPYLPASEAASLGDVDAALVALQDLGKAHEALAGGLKGLLAQIPETDAAKYNDKMLATAQAVGIILEHGKLAAGDEVKYAKMLPKPYDSPERRQAKLENVAQLLIQSRAARSKAFKQAGYRMEGFDAPTPASGPTRAPASQAMPKDASGNLTLETPASGDMVRVKINGQERAIPRGRVEAFKARAAERKDKFEVIDG